MGKNWKDTISKEKLKDSEIDEALQLFLKSRVQNASASQNDAEATKEKDSDEAAEQPAQETAQSGSKEYFTIDEVDKLIAKKVEEQLKKKKQDENPLQTPSFVNPKPPAAFKVLKMKEA